jgi:hypothetical protein
MLDLEWPGIIGHPWQFMGGIVNLPTVDSSGGTSKEHGDEAQSGVYVPLVGR